ncbi:MAG: hypothetical protein AAFQ10_03390 [Pseudomonadota bacterium]
MLSGPRKSQQLATLDVPYAVAAGAVIHQGAIVVLDAGLAKPGFADPAVKTVGVALVSDDNSEGGDGAGPVVVRREEVWLMDNDANDPVTAADIGDDCFVKDDHTVSSTDGGGTQAVAGEIIKVDAGGVWVRL